MATACERSCFHIYSPQTACPSPASSFKGKWLLLGRTDPRREAHALQKWGWPSNTESPLTRAPPPRPAGRLEVSGLVGRTRSKLDVCRVALWTSLGVTNQRSGLVSTVQGSCPPVAQPVSMTTIHSHRSRDTQTSHPHLCAESAGGSQGTEGLGTNPTSDLTHPGFASCVSGSASVPENEEGGTDTSPRWISTSRAGVSTREPESPPPMSSLLAAQSRPCRAVLDKDSLSGKGWGRSPQSPVP